MNTGRLKTFSAHGVLNGVIVSVVAETQVIDIQDISPDMIENRLMQYLKIFADAIKIGMLSTIGMYER